MLTTKQSSSCEENVKEKSNTPFFPKHLVQTKLQVNEPGDSYEREADAMADHVMRGGSHSSAPKSFFKPSAYGVQRKCQHCEEEEKLHRKESSGAGVQGSDHLDNYVSSLSLSGTPLPEASRKFFEPRFGQDFSNVRIHNDSVAAKSAQSINALAYTTGNNIVFNQGQYSPDSESGKRLMAHELTHVVQQKAASTLIQRESQTGTSAPFHKNDHIPEEIYQATSRCTPASGKLNTDCGIYFDNLWWLPLAYANNARCACSSTPNSPKYNCIRKFLQDRLAATPTSLKLLAASQKVNDIPGTPGYSIYQAFVQSILTPRIYRDHSDAYSSCCCSSGPATYAAWIGVTAVPIQPCSLVGLSIKYTGNCDGTPGVW